MSFENGTPVETGIIETKAEELETDFETAPSYYEGFESDEVERRESEPLAEQVPSTTWSEAGSEMGVASRPDNPSNEDESLFERLQRVAFRYPYRPQELFPFSSLDPGLPRGALTEIFGNEGGGKTEALLRFLAENRGLRAAWIEPEISVYPPALDQYGVDYRRLLFVETGSSALIWSALQVLRSRIFPVVVIVGGERALQWTAKQLRLLQLEAERAEASVILLHERATAAESWPLALQLRIQRKQGSFSFGSESPDREGTPDPVLECQVLRAKGGISWKGLAT